MTKDPAILFYTADFSEGSRFFSNEQTGKYIRALCAQHQHGHLSLDQLNQIISNDTYVLDKFKKDRNGLFYNERMEIEINRRNFYAESRRKNVMNRYHKKDKPLINKRVKSNTYVPTYDLHMENENRNENEDINGNIVINEVLDYLNSKINTHYRADTAGFISGRLKEGYTIDDFKKVIDKKYLQWAGDEKMSKFLRPKTLFSPEHFQEYLNELDHVDPNFERKQIEERQRLKRERGEMS
jgi:uncharacterized phage protein (TIGR02220 family)